jgi:thiamine-phosphate pyrophosphorylase
LAADAGAAGLHLPEARIREAGHWRARHPGWIITASVHAAAALAQAQDLDALLLSPVFATTSHPGAGALGPVRAGRIAAASHIPVYALGGIVPQTAARLPRAFSGIAAITGLL